MDCLQPAISGYVGVNGLEMYYEIHGQAAPETLPLIVLHGAYMNIPSMGAIIPRLAETHTVYALELQGHGRTTDIDRPITYPNLADDVAAFMDAVDLKKADVFGYSMGAAGWSAARHPPPGEGEQARRSFRCVRCRGLAAGIQGAHPADEGGDVPRNAVRRGLSQARAPIPKAFPSLVKKLIQLEKEPMAWEEDVRALKTPVLIIGGDADGATLEHFVAMFRLLGGGVMGDMGNPLPARASPSCRRLRTPPSSPRQTCCLVSSNLS